LPGDTVIEPDRALAAEELPAENAGYWQALAADNAPALRQLSLAVKITGQQDKIVRAERWPQVALMAANHFDGPITFEAPPINKNFNYWYVGVGVRYKLSSLYKTDAAVRKSQLGIMRAKEQYDEAREQTELAVRAGHIRYLEARSQLAARQKGVELALQNHDVVRHRYAGDLALITELLDASSHKLEAELQLANARVNIVYNYYKLKYLSGTL
jgi:outer membrane protein TolC